MLAQTNVDMRLTIVSICMMLYLVYMYITPASIKYQLCSQFMRNQNCEFYQYFNSNRYAYYDDELI